MLRWNELNTEEQDKAIALYTKTMDKLSEKALEQAQEAFKIAVSTGASYYYFDRSGELHIFTGGITKC